MKAALLLATALQLALSEVPQDRVDGDRTPVEREKERIRSRAPLTEAQKAVYIAAEPGPAKPRASYTLAVVPIEFTDVKLGSTDLSKRVFGAVGEYYSRASSGRFTLSGKVVPKILLEIDRARFERKDLEKAVGGLPALDGVAFIVPGAVPARGSPLWPHRGVVRVDEKELDYLLVPEAAPVAILAHEFMHLLGFADKYDDDKASVADACILGTGYSVQAPPPPCVECRLQLGWAAAASVDPGVASSIRMDADLSKAVRIPLTPEGDEALLLELRERLFIWHVGGGKKIELIGRFPSETSDRLTPLSEPSFRGRSVGARTVCITDIRLQDGKAWFQVGPDAPLTSFEEWRREKVGKRLGD